MKYPKKINNSPLYEALCELRFKSNIPKDIVYALIYNGLFKENQIELVSLPILQVPSEIRNHDYNFLYKPHYRLEENGYFIQFGPDVFSIGLVNKYFGWEEFKKDISKYIKKLEETNVIDILERISIRYINLFLEKSLELNETNLSIKFPAYPIEKFDFTAKIEKNGYEVNYHISNNSVLYDHNNNTSTFGSLIDIDTYKNINKKIDNIEIIDHIISMHELTKTIFFDSLKEVQIQKMNPEY